MTDTLFTFRDREKQALAAKVAGIQRADDHADPDWKAKAYDAILWCARMRPTFTSDDVVERMDAQGIAGAVTPSALGPVFLKASKANEIRKTGQLRPTRIARRHRELTVWTAA